MCWVSNGWENKLIHTASSSVEHVVEVAVFGHVIHTDILDGGPLQGSVPAVLGKHLN